MNANDLRRKLDADAYVRRVRRQKETPMFDYLNYTAVEGRDSRHDVEIYALSTCGFCKRALSFLLDKGLAHRYVHLDLVSIETKNRAKAELKEKFGEHISFPYAVIDEKITLIGFIEADWRKTLIDS